MPPIKKYSKDTIIEVAMQLIEKHGFKNLTARALAHELGCTVNPIFNNFKSMEELEHSVYERIYEMYKTQMIEGSIAENGYKGMGLAYIDFARKHPEFFKILFMQTTTMNPEKFILADSVGNNVIEVGQKLTGLSYEEQKSFHVKVWIFTHGIACLIATDTVKMDDREVEELLGATVVEMLRGYKEGKKR